MTTDRRTGISVREVAVIENVRNLKESFIRHLHFDVVKDRNISTPRDFYQALAHTAWDQLCSRWIRTFQHYRKFEPKCVHFLSMEFCMGRTLTNTMLNVNITDPLDEALYQLGLNMEELEEIEDDAGLGNGGLGRLAACFLDSMATLGIAAYGHGIRYEHGAFHQKIKDGWQVEEADEWLQYGNPWEKERPEYSKSVRFGGRVVHGERGRAQWVDTQVVEAIPYDSPIPGYRNNTCNTLRLWAAKASKLLDLDGFFQEDYINVVLARNHAENISRVLYPIDHEYEGKQLRLRQEYFLVSATLQDILHQFKETSRPLGLFDLPYKIAIHINDTHSALAIPELMRILIDEEQLMWLDAWDICYNTFTHTNHVAQLETLKHWPLEMIKSLLPRHMEIIGKINAAFCQSVKKRWPYDTSHFQRMSIIRGTSEKPIVSMDHLSIVGSHKVNGVSRVQTKHLKTVLFKDFAELWPEKFVNKTNGITPRRWLLLCNPGLADLITGVLRGDETWPTNLTMIQCLRDHVNDAKLRLSIMRVKQDNKNRFAMFMREQRNVFMDPCTLFDVMVKRVDEYKRHLLLCLYIMTLHHRIKSDSTIDICSRTFILGGNASPGHSLAKLVIKLIYCLQQTINCDPCVAGRLKIVFLKNYRVSIAERIVPAADLSEQIPCVGTEAAGTGNMKFMLNGALTICTRDGVNVEIIEEAGQQNVFVFGRTLEEVKAIRTKGYDPRKYISNNAELEHCLELLRSGYYNPAEPALFAELYQMLITEDRFLICADYGDYLRAQTEVDRTYRDAELWSRMVLHNMAGAGKFSSDQTVSEYSTDMWHIEPSREKLPIPSEPVKSRNALNFYIDN